ncbi:MAG: sensor histidine kinase [Rudaea sp.]
MLARWRNLPLRVRLTFLYVALLTIILGVLISTLYFDTRNFLISTTVLRLRSQAQPGVERVYRSGPPRPVPTPPAGELAPIVTVPVPPTLEEVAGFLAESQTSANVTAAVYDANARLLADGRTLPEQPVSAPADATHIARTLAGDPGNYYITSVSGADALVVLIPLHVNSPQAQPNGVLQLTTRLDLVDQVLSRQRLLILIGVALTLLIGSVGGLWLTGSALAPLQQMISTSRRIAGGDLSQRVNLPRRGDEIGQLAASFDEMVARLEEAFAAQRQFIADASHELRTPLTALAGSLDVVLMAPEGDPEASRRMLTGMRRELARLTRLVNDLLTLSRLDARRELARQDVDLAALAREVVEQIKPMAGERQVLVEIKGETRLGGDPDRLRQVLLNLLDNAIRFTDAQNGVVHVAIAGADSRVRLRVTDNGSGIPTEARAHIFERFYRVDRARARASGGSGLGLAIVKAIVEAHGGTIRAESNGAQGGSVFEAVLPREPITSTTKTA